MRKVILTQVLTLRSALPVRAANTDSIGINVPTYSTLQRIPDYALYYVPRLHAN